MNNWTGEAWRSLVESAPEGIVICDATAPDCPVVFVNAAFAQMCGYPATALVGSNLRMLQGTDRDQEARARLHQAVEKGEAAPDYEQITIDSLYRYLFRRARSIGAAATPQRFVQGGVELFVFLARSSVGEHPLHTRGVVGSIPTVPTISSAGRKAILAL